MGRQVRRLLKGTGQVTHEQQENVCWDAQTSGAVTTMPRRKVGGTSAVGSRANGYTVRGNFTDIENLLLDSALKNHGETRPHTLQGRRADYTRE
jgi:hypothetical protein